MADSLFKIVMLLEDLLGMKAQPCTEPSFNLILTQLVSDSTLY